MLMVVKEFMFDSAHYLPNYVGPCNRMHGHTYRLQVGVSGLIDPNTGMVVDFSKLNRVVKEILKDLDHQLLNEIQVPNFPSECPTAENMVSFFVNRISEELASLPSRQPEDFNLCMQVEMVRLWETPTSYAEWRR